jgi:multiple sugar transport system permease protein
MKALFGRDWASAYPFVLPMVIVMVGFIAWPFVNAIMISTTSLNLSTGETINVGFRNYERLIHSADYRMVMSNTVQFTFWSLLLKFVTGMTIAIVLNSRLPLRGLLSGLMLLPWIVPEIVTALAWKSIFDPIYGGLNPMLKTMGVIERPIGWLSDSNLAMPSIIAVNVWKGIPFFTLLLLAGLKAVDRELLEAAEVDGATAIQRFRHVTLPSMRYVIIVTLLLSFISTFNQFGLPFLLTAGGPGGATKLYSLMAYERAVGSLQYGPGSAVAFSVAPLMAILIWLLARYMRQEQRRPANDGPPSLGDKVIALGGWLLGRSIDLVLLPFELVARAWLWLGRTYRGRNEKSGKARSPAAAIAAAFSKGGYWRLIALLPFLFFVAFPFFWIVITSLKTNAQISQNASLYWPDPATPAQYQRLIEGTQFLQWFGQSALVSAASTLLSVFIASMGAYALSRLKFRGAGLLTTLLLITYLLPGTLLFIPLYQILTDLGLINTQWTLILTYPIFLLPFATWVLLGYFRSIPIELDEAAMIDGASRFYIYWRIILPLAAPAVLAVTLFAFTSAWNEFLFAFVFVNSESLRTLPIGLQSMVAGDVLPWGQLMAASVLTAVPVTVLYVFAQRFLAGGLTVGAVKG